MLMYRVESKMGRRGAYRTDASCLAMIDNDERHPAPWDDEGLSKAWGVLLVECGWEGRDRYLFGFEFTGDYFEWFHNQDGRQAMAAHHCLAVYEIPEEHCRTGDKQMIAHEIHMRHVEDLDTFTLEKIS